MIEKGNPDTNRGPGISRRKRGAGYKTSFAPRIVVGPWFKKWVDFHCNILYYLDQGTIDRIQKGILRTGEEKEKGKEVSRMKAFLDMMMFWITAWALICWHTNSSAVVAILFGG